MIAQSSVYVHSNTELNEHIVISLAQTVRENDADSESQYTVLITLIHLSTQCWKRKLRKVITCRVEMTC
jgi:hypothetical protein